MQKCVFHESWRHASGLSPTTPHCVHVAPPSVVPNRPPTSAPASITDPSLGDTATAGNAPHPPGSKRCAAAETLAAIARTLLLQSRMQLSLARRRWRRAWPATAMSSLLSSTTRPRAAVVSCPPQTRLLMMTNISTGHSPRVHWLGSPWEHASVTHCGNLG